jgi:hypothetical protein
MEFSRGFQATDYEFPNDLFRRISDDGLSSVATRRYDSGLDLIRALKGPAKIRRR